jgi:ABC-type amino acid transport substrate-binding protein
VDAAVAWSTILGTAIALVTTVITVLATRKAKPAGGGGDTGGAKDRVEGQPATSRIEAVKGRGSFRFGCLNHWPLISWRTEAGDTFVFEGLYVEIARKVGEIAGLEVELVPMDWGELSRSFDTYDLDAVLSVFETRARLEFGEFVAPMHKVGVGALVPVGGNKVRELPDLLKGDVKVAVVNGEVGWEVAVHDLKIPRHRLILVDSADLRNIFGPLLTGAADVGIIDAVSCAELIASNPGYEHLFQSDPIQMCKNSIMVPRADNAFAEWIDDLFIQARSDAEILQTEAKLLLPYRDIIRRFR